MRRQGGLETLMDGAGEVEDQVEDLKERMRMLQNDRKANMELLEATKEANKDIIQELRKEGKDLRQKLSAFQKELSAAKPGNELEDLGSLKKSVGQQRKLYDDLKHRVELQRKSLEELKDEIRDLERQGAKPNQDDSVETRKIRFLEARLDKAMIKYNEAVAIRKTYEQIVKRLKAERISYDSQVSAIEKALKTKQQDYEELLLLATDANHAKEAALQELEKVKGGYEEERQRRLKQLKEKLELLAIKKELRNRMEQRAKARQEIIAKEAGDLTEEQEVALRASLTMNKLQAGKVVHDKSLNKNKLDLFENAFRRIKEATGVTDVNEILKKIVNQEATTDNLMSLSRENQLKIEILSNDTTRLKERVEDLKFSGVGGVHRRKAVDDQEETLNTASGQLDRAKIKYERLSKLLIGVKAGVEHLSDRVKSAQGEHQSEYQRVEVNDDNLVDVMYTFEQSISQISNELKANEATVQTLSAIHQESDEEELLDGNNRNVLKAKLLMEESASENSDGEDQSITSAEIAVDEDDTLSRDKVKRASVQILEAQNKKKRVAGRRRAVKQTSNDDYGDSQPELQVPATNGTNVG